MQAREGKKDRRGGGSTASNTTSHRGLSGEEAQELAGQQQQTATVLDTSFILHYVPNNFI